MHFAPVLIMCPTATFYQTAGVLAPFIESLPPSFLQPGLSLLPGPAPQLPLPPEPKKLNFLKCCVLSARCARLATTCHVSSLGSSASWHIHGCWLCTGSALLCSILAPGLGCMQPRTACSCAVRLCTCVSAPCAPLLLMCVAVLHTWALSCIVAGFALAACHGRLVCRPLRSVSPRAPARR